MAAWVAYLHIFLVPLCWYAVSERKMLLTDVYPFLGNRVRFFFIGPEYQAGPDFLYSNTITNRVRIVVGSDNQSGSNCC